MSHQWHHISFEETLEKLKTNRENGLNSSKVVLLQQEHGSNTLPQPKKRSFFSIILHQFLSPLIYLLIVAATISFAIGDKKDAAVILVVVFLNAIIGAIQEGRAEQSLAALRKLSKIKARVIRDGEEVEIESSEIVPGDILTIGAGDAVVADARIVEASNLTVAEAALTGESMPVTKSSPTVPANASLADRHNMLYAGTYITSGRAVAAVTAIGQKNEIGKIAHLTTETIQPKTQLEQRIAHFGRYIVLASVAIFFLVIGFGLYHGIAFNEIFMIAVSQMVSLVPEGLPVALTIALAVGVQRMARKGTVVRRLSAVETLGSITVICTDKTGTLTKNEMTVVELFLAQEESELELTGVGYNPDGDLIEKKSRTKIERDQIKQNKVLKKIIEASSLCNDSQLLEPNEDNINWSHLGDPTEVALLTMALKLGGDPAGLRKKYHRVADLPFDSDTKMMATQHLVDGQSVVYIKGAPEVLLDLCTPGCDHERIKLAGRDMADRSLRVLGVGFIPNTHIDGEKGFEFFRGKVEFLGLIGELDPPREEVKDSIRDCLAAGIKPVMVTGDHKATGLSIAKSLGISLPDDLALDGQELDQLNDLELAQKIDHISVFARVHPAQKLRIIQAFQSRGHIVAMTGDGVNDAPALVKANVGVAMGITGTEVAKEAAKIVITDDNFATIVAAIAEGRLVYQNIKKLVLFLFVTSLDEVAVLFLALIMGYPPPLAAVQILWINLVSEGALTVNLIMEPFEGSEMRRSPVPVNEPLIDRALILRMPLMVLASVTSTFGWFFYRTSLGIPADQVQTETFTVLVVSQWCNVLNCRSAIRSAFSRSLFSNPWLLGGLILANLMHLLVIYWAPLAKFFHTVPIAPEQFLLIGGVATLVLWVEEIRKYLVRRKLTHAH